MTVASPFTLSEIRRDQMLQYINKDTSNTNSRLETHSVSIVTADVTRRFLGKCGYLFTCVIFAFVYGLSDSEIWDVIETDIKCLITSSFNYGLVSVVMKVFSLARCLRIPKSKKVETRPS